MKKILQTMVFAFVLLITIGVSFAANNVSTSNDVELEYIRINGDIYQSGENIRVDVNEELDIRVKLQALADVEDVEVSTRLVGYEYSDYVQVSDHSGVFDLRSGDTDFIDLQVQVPVDSDKDVYDLRVTVQDRRYDYSSNSFTIRVSGPRNQMLVRDVIFSPGGSVVAGRALLAQLRLENIGENDQEDIKVTTRIPALNIVESTYVREVRGEAMLGRGERLTTEEIYLRIPQCAEEGIYDVEFEVEYNRFDVVSFTEEIVILKSELCTNSSSTPQPTETEKTVISAPQAQMITAGVSGSSFPVVIQNDGSSARTYTIGVTGVENWGTHSLSEQAPIVNPGQSKTVYVYVNAKEDAPLGVQTFGIDVSTQGKTQSVLAQANIVAPEKESNLTEILTISVIVLVIILVLLGIIVVFTKLRGRDDEDMEKGKAYY